MSRKTWGKKSRADRRLEIENLQSSIVSEVDKLRDSQRWAEFLEMSKAFHRYSLNNLLLIMSQRPDATQVAGYQTWRELGRQVRKGERGIRIFGGRPVSYTATDQVTGEEEELTRTWFFPVSVFDIAQTDPINPHEPTKGELAVRLEGDDVAGIYGKVEAHLNSMGWEVARDNLGSEMNGYTELGGTKRIVVHSDLSPAQAAKTLIHEAGHVHMHAAHGAADYVAHRGIRETEAESVAYIVAGSFGLDTSSYSIGYVAGWSNADTELIKSTAQNVITNAHKIIDALEQIDMAAPGTNANPLRQMASKSVPPAAKPQPDPSLTHASTLSI